MIFIIIKDKNNLTVRQAGKRIGSIAFCRTSCSKIRKT